MHVAPFLKDISDSLFSEIYPFISAAASSSAQGHGGQVANQTEREMK